MKSDTQSAPMSGLTIKECFPDFLSFDPRNALGDNNIGQANKVMGYVDTIARSSSVGLLTPSDFPNIEQVSRGVSVIYPISGCSQVGFAVKPFKFGSGAGVSGS